MSILHKLIFLFFFFLFKTNSQAQSYDSSFTLEKITKADSLHLDSLYNLSYDLSFYDLDSALIIIEEFLSYSRKKNNLNIELGMTNKGYLHTQLGDQKTALDCFFYVLKLGENKGDSILISQAFNDIAMVYMELQD